MKEALYYQTIDVPPGSVGCNLCPHRCVIAPGRSGICRVRRNDDGRLVSLVYGQFAAVHLDPIEKKPLYHFHPGSMILSVGTVGCNFRCLHCQNWEISQAAPGAPSVGKLSPGEAVAYARKLGSLGIAYTYNEPLVNYEWVLETSKLISATRDLKNVLVTNAYAEEEPWRELVGYTHASNIDIKAFDDDFYKKICGGRLETVLRNIEIMVKSRKHVELTCLLIPGVNDYTNKIEDMTSWIAAIDADIPLHLTRYFPNYKMAAPPTPPETLFAARDTARKKLRRVYTGNL